MVEETKLGKRIAACDLLIPSTFFAATAGSAFLSAALVYGPLIWLYGDGSASFGQSMLTLIVFVSLLVFFNIMFAMNAWRFPGCGSKVIWMENGLVSWEHERERTVVFAEANRIQIETIEQSVGDLYESSGVILRVTDAFGTAHQWQSTFDRDSRKGKRLAAQFARLETELGAKVKKTQWKKQMAEDFISRMLSRAWIRYSRLFTRFE